MRSLSFFISHPREVTQGIVRKVFGNVIKDDKKYLSLLYKSTFWERMDWDNPNTFNAKLTWRKVYERNPIFTTMADKYAVKKYVEDIIGKEYVVENYGVYNSWDDINFDLLPNQFVMKCTHDSGGSFLCKDKSTFDFERVKSILTKNLRTNNYNVAREWPYKNVPHRIIIDRLLDDHTGDVLRDYKFWCFNGVPTYMYCTVKDKKIYENFYDMDFKPVMIDHGFPRHIPEFERPSQFELMKELAAKLSKGISFVRVDFFQVDNKVYFGEFTFSDWGGTRPFGGDWDKKIGDLLVLKDKY